MTIDTIKEVQAAFKTAAEECGIQNPALLTLLISDSQVCEELIEAKKRLDKGLEICKD